MFIKYINGVINILSIFIMRLRKAYNNVQGQDYTRDFGIDNQREQELL